ncbi:hypothetical protein ACFL1M_04530, partial [Patescibacteria group bacterium]
MTNNLPSKTDDSLVDPKAKNQTTNVSDDNVMNGQAGSMAKEQLESRPIVDSQEKVPITEMKESESVPEEVSSWMEKLEQGEDVKLPQPVVHDD